MTRDELLINSRKAHQVILDKVKEYHNPELAKIDGQHVTQLWWDGEITSQKGGSLFNQRNLHSFQPGFNFPVDSTLKWKNFDKEEFPAKNEGYAIVTSQHADEIRLLMIQYHLMILALHGNMWITFAEFAESTVPIDQLV